MVPNEECILLEHAMLFAGPSPAFPLFERLGKPRWEINGQFDKPCLSRWGVQRPCTSFTQLIPYAIVTLGRQDMHKQTIALGSDLTALLTHAAEVDESASGPAPRIPLSLRLRHLARRVHVLPQQHEKGSNSDVLRAPM